MQRTADFTWSDHLVGDVQRNLVPSTDIHSKKFSTLNFNNINIKIGQHIESVAALEPASTKSR